jgi:hypothetical protein
MHRLLRHASGLQLLRQRVCQAAAGCEECNDADYPRVAPALCLALVKEHDGGACQSGLCRFENAILATRDGINALETGLSRQAISCSGAAASWFKLWDFRFRPPLPHAPEHLSAPKWAYPPTGGLWYCRGERVYSAEGNLQKNPLWVRNC